MGNGSPPAIDFAEANCVAAYRAVRAKVNTENQLGQGRNLLPPPEALIQHISNLIAPLANSNRINDYGTRADAGDRFSAATLLNRFLKREAISADDIFFTTGTTEAISLTTSYLAGRNYSLRLPLPCYYAFEQSAKRYGARIAGYYNEAGEIAPCETSAKQIAHIQIIPNGVTGRHFLHPGKQSEAYKIVDAVFQIPSQPGTHPVGEPLREAMKETDLHHGCLMMTASKDLSVPGLRPGLLVTKDPVLKRYLARDRFERSYSICLIGSQVILAYLAILNFIDPENTAEDLTGIHRGLPPTSLSMLPSLAATISIVRDLRAMQSRYSQGLTAIRETMDQLAVPFDDYCPSSGYSLFPQIPTTMTSQKSFTQWCNWMGRRRGLKLNPPVVFGGNDAVWEKLYPRTSYIRLNCSDEPDIIRKNMATLIDSIRHA
ncbi:hypothetical protein FA951_13380 [Dermacoccus nishinomiyaensis]|uniref:hypothetical protein n=1 Tax=Dermacoccus nishinomiyaensis TaxID=1274 RepID=UPI0010ABAD46|nr:hypothetical protein [Dermacoccus nishinomiyaensis]TJZ94873.1 hypothetical protein FA951_13380 [Dermacoccus nishinomiyaensis]